MQPDGNCSDSQIRVKHLSVCFLRRLHDISASIYNDALLGGVIRPDEMEDEIQRYFMAKKSGLQDVYSYYAEQWDYYYRVVAASDADFLPMLQRARSAFSRLYAPIELDVVYYIEQLVAYSREEERWQSLRKYFTQKWKNLLDGRERTYQMRHIEELCKDYYRMVAANAEMLQNMGGRGEGVSPRLAWLQLTQSPELRIKIRQLSQVMRKNRIVRELNEVLGRKQADEQRLYRAMQGAVPVAMLRSATHSDIVGITDGNNLNALLPIEYCYMSDDKLESIFYRRYAEKKLAVFDAVSRQTEFIEASSFQGHDLQNRAKHGPFVVCVDTSASMEGERELLSKAIVLSLALIADKLRRPCRVVLFSDQTEVIELNNLYTDLPLLESFLCNAFHGGSGMSSAMKESVEALMHEDFRYADLLWLSDFEMPSLSPVWIQYIDELKQKGMRLYAVCFGHRAEVSYIRQSDRVWTVD